LNQDNPELPIIYTSGYSPDIAAFDFPLKEGINFLGKPFSLPNLARIVRNRLDEPLPG